MVKFNKDLIKKLPIRGVVEEALTKASWNPNMNPPKITINMAKIGSPF